MTARRLLVSIALATLAPAAGATPQLFATFRDGASPIVTDALYQVDPSTAASSLVADLPVWVWGDITGRTGDAENLYSVVRLPGTAWENQVLTIDRVSGALTDLYSFTGSDFGLAPTFGLELTGITFDPFDSSVATILGAVVDFTFVLPVSSVLFDLDLDTGVVSGFQTLVSPGANNLTYSSDGTLFTRLYFPFEGQLATLDVASGVVTGIGTCPANCNLRAIEFDPISGELYGVTFAGDLVLLSPTTGEILETIGPTGLGGVVRSVTGLAFVVPEPATGVLLAVGLAALAAQRRRARR